VGAGEEDVVIVFDQFRPHTFVDAFRFMADNPHLLFADKMIVHLRLSGFAIGVSLVIAIPLGVWLGHIHRGSFLAINSSNVLRALPSLATIAIGISVFGLGAKNVVFALTVLGAPPMLTNAYVAVDGVERGITEAARGMGMKPLQMLLRVELPLALPLIFAGIRTSVVFIVATATLGAFVGGGGLGDIIVNQASYGLGGVIAGALVIAALAFAADFAFGGLQRLVTPPGLRTKVSAFEPDVVTARVAELPTA
jgi:osmoprotectant transport system permease protein